MWLLSIQELLNTSKKYKIMKSISPNLNLMIKACEKSIKNINSRFWRNRKSSSIKKGTKDFVTNADKNVEKVLINELIEKKIFVY